VPRHSGELKAQKQQARSRHVHGGVPVCFWRRGKRAEGQRDKRKGMGIRQWHWVSGEVAGTRKGDQKSLVGA